MEKILFLLAMLLIPSTVFPQQKISKLDKAKQLIRKEFKDTMNDYASYSPVSYGSVDSLFTSLSEDEYGLMTFMRADKAKEEAGLGDIEGLPDVSQSIKRMEADERLYKTGAIEKWKIY